MKAINNTNANSALHRHDLSDAIWATIELSLPGRRGTWGGGCKGQQVVENAFLTMKQWRGGATRYAKRLSAYLACVQIRCLHTWLKAIS
jgi:transposase